MGWMTAEKRSFSVSRPARIVIRLLRGLSGFLLPRAFGAHPKPASLASSATGSARLGFKSPRTISTTNKPNGPGLLVVGVDDGI